MRFTRASNRSHWQHNDNVGFHLNIAATLSNQWGPLLYVGAGAIILPDIKIGNRATIGAGAVVTEDVAGGTTVVGNPARELQNQSI